MNESALARLTVTLSSLIGVVMSATGLGYFISPLFRKQQESWSDVGKSGDFKPGEPRLVEFTGRKRDAWVTSENRSSVWVVKGENGQFTAFDPKCTHLGCPYRWDVKSTKFICPCHTAAFGLDGKVMGGPPPRPLDQFEIKVAQERLMVLPEHKDAHEGEKDKEKGKDS
jgi:menaquinol-cytochrome c reductase iron-sulfur subunit